MGGARPQRYRQGSIQMGKVEGTLNIKVNSFGDRSDKLVGRLSEGAKVCYHFFSALTR